MGGAGGYKKIARPDPDAKFHVLVGTPSRSVLETEVERPQHPT